MDGRGPWWGGLGEGAIMASEVIKEVTLGNAIAIT